MLDQNTDRLWYVIGAILVGAAIVLLLNGAAPQLFASVGDTFEDVWGSTEDDIQQITGKENLLEFGSMEMEGGYYITPDGSVWGYENQDEFLRHEDLAPIFEEYGPDQTYTLSFEMKSKDTSKQDQMRVYMQTSSGTKYDFIGEVVDVSEDYQTYTFENLRPTLNKRNLQSDNPYDTAHLAFYGGYGTGNIPVVRNVELTKE